MIAKVDEYIVRSHLHVCDYGVLVTSRQGGGERNNWYVDGFPVLASCVLNEVVQFVDVGVPRCHTVKLFHDGLQQKIHI